MEFPKDKDEMPQPAGRAKGSSKILVIILLVAALALGYLLYARVSSDPPSEPQPAASGSQTGPSAQPEASPSTRGQLSPEQAPGAPPPPPPSDHSPVVSLDADGQAKSPEDQAREQKERMEPYGLSKSLDAVVRSDESIKVGDTTIAVSELEKSLVVGQRGEVLEKPLSKAEAERRVTAWGVHLVRPNENLWNIHYRLLREYMASQGINLAEASDEPLPSGKSSGVGKILKFAEHMVGVFNLKTHAMTSDLNRLEAGRKVVVFNLSEIFAQLAKINPRDLSGVMYDGRVLLFPEGPSSAPAKPTTEAPPSPQPEGQ